MFKITIKTPERHQWRRSGVFVANFEHIPNLIPGLLLLTLNIQLPVGKTKFGFWNPLMNISWKLIIVAVNFSEHSTT